MKFIITLCLLMAIQFTSHGQNGDGIPKDLDPIYTPICTGWDTSTDLVLEYINLPDNQIDTGGLSSIFTDTIWISAYEGVFNESEELYELWVQFDATYLMEDLADNCLENDFTIVNVIAVPDYPSKKFIYVFDLRGMNQSIEELRSLIELCASWKRGRKNTVIIK